MSEWPLASDYQEAIQNPRFCFTDPELQQGSVFTDKLGLPRPDSGNFATVYRVTAPSRQKWAVRCFTRDVPDHRGRYDAISAFIKASKLPWMVSFEYRTDGIRAKGRMWPIVKMEWVD